MPVELLGAGDYFLLDVLTSTKTYLNITLTGKLENIPNNLQNHLRSRTGNVLDVIGPCACMTSPYVVHIRAMPEANQAVLRVRKKKSLINSSLPTVQSGNRCICTYVAG